MDYKMTQQQYEKIDQAFEILVEKQKDVFNYLESIGMYEVESVDRDEMTEEQEDKYDELEKAYHDQAYATRWEMLDIRYQENWEEKERIAHYIDILENCNSLETWVEDIYRDVTGSAVIIEEETEEEEN